MSVWERRLCRKRGHSAPLDNNRCDRTNHAASSHDITPRFLTTPDMRRWRFEYICISDEIWKWDSATAQTFVMELNFAAIMTIPFPGWDNEMVWEQITDVLMPSFISPPRFTICQARGHLLSKGAGSERLKMKSTRSTSGVIIEDNT